MMEQLWNNRKARLIILLTLTILYFAGIICLFFNTGLGILLWGAALIPSLILFMWQKHHEQLQKTLKQDEEKEQEKNQ